MPLPAVPRGDGGDRRTRGERNARGRQERADARRGLAWLALGWATPAGALDRVTLGTDWRAQAEHGGYYQALAAGIYERHGLDVAIRQGGPQVNHGQLLAAGRIDFGVGANLFEQFNFTQNGVPMVTVAAFFQKEPQ